MWRGKRKKAIKLVVLVLAGGGGGVAAIMAKCSLRHRPVFMINLVYLSEFGVQRSANELCQPLVTSRRCSWLAYGSLVC